MVSVPQFPCHTTHAAYSVVGNPSRRGPILVVIWALHELGLRVRHGIRCSDTHICLPIVVCFLVRDAGIVAPITCVVDRPSRQQNLERAPFPNVEPNNSACSSPLPRADPHQSRSVETSRPSESSRSTNSLTVCLRGLHKLTVLQKRLWFLLPMHVACLRHQPSFVGCPRVRDLVGIVAGCARRLWQ
jgi:hypothetical protein